MVSYKPETVFYFGNGQKLWTINALQNNKKKKKLLKIGITQGDINGIGYEVILKTLADPRMLELCIPVIYGSSKAIGYYKKLLELDHLSINIVKSADEAGAKRINIINCGADELKVEMKKQLDKDFAGIPYLFISSVAQQGLTELKDKLWQMLNTEA